MTVSRRTLLSSLALLLPAAAADAATKPHKPAHKPHRVAKAAPHGKPAKARKVARRHTTPAKPPAAGG